MALRFLRFAYGRNTVFYSLDERSGSFSELRGEKRRYSRLRSRSDSPKSATKYYALDEKSLFKCNDAKDLAAKIDWWIEHPKEKEEYSAKYAEISKEKFDHAACMQAMEDMLLKTASVKKA